MVGDPALRALPPASQRDGSTGRWAERDGEERGQHDRAADGTDSTIEALQKGQVRTLILTDARDTDQQGWGGPEPTHLARDAQALTDLGIAVSQQAPLDELLLRAAWGTGADVQFVTGDVEESPGDGIGALLRYAD